MAEKQHAAGAGSWEQGIATPPQAYRGSPSMPEANTAAPSQGYVAPQQPMYAPATEKGYQAPQMGNNQGYMPAAPQPWRYSFWDCCKPTDVCCLAYWCPCILFGKTHHRISDPRMETYSCCNGACWGWYCLAHCGLSWILQMGDRGNIRYQHNIQGSGGFDCVESWCCPCCGLMQQEKEYLTLEN